MSRITYLRRSEYDTDPFFQFASSRRPHMNRVHVFREYRAREAKFCNSDDQQKQQGLKECVDLMFNRELSSFELFQLLSMLHRLVKDSIIEGGDIINCIAESGKHFRELLGLTELHGQATELCILVISLILQIVRNLDDHEFTAECGSIIVILEEQKFCYAASDSKFSSSQQLYNIKLAKLHSLVLSRFIDSSAYSETMVKMTQQHKLLIENFVACQSSDSVHESPLVTENGKLFGNVSMIYHTINLLLQDFLAICECFPLKETEATKLLLALSDWGKGK